MMRPPHNIGRWWDAVLRLEEATGFVIPGELEAAMLTHLKCCLDNPLGVCGHLMPWEQFPPGWIDFHAAAGDDAPLRTRRPLCPLVAALGILGPWA